MKASSCQRLQILDLEDDFAGYQRLFGKVRTESAYLLPSYLKAARIGERHPVKVMAFEEQGEIALLPLVIRRLNDLPFFAGLERELWDLVSPYEYSSVATNADSDRERSRLTGRLLDLVAGFCAGGGVVSEFLRCDPFLADLEAVGSRYQVKKSCDNIYIDLRQDLTAISKAFHSSVRKNLRAAATAGLSFSAAEKSAANIARFITLYQGSMQRLGAKEYYYFSPEYFHALLSDCEGASLFFVHDAGGRPVASSIVLHHGSIGHHHLTGCDPEALQLRPNDFMIYSLIQWGQARGLSSLHLGGGPASIREFKGKFSPDRAAYHVACRVHDQELYRELCQIRQREPDFEPQCGYFPLYRAGS